MKAKQIPKSSNNKAQGNKPKLKPEKAPIFNQKEHEALKKELTEEITKLKKEIIQLKQEYEQQKANIKSQGNLKKNANLPEESKNEIKKPNNDFFKLNQEKIEKELEIKDFQNINKNLEKDNKVLQEQVNLHKEIIKKMQEENKKKVIETIMYQYQNQLDQKDKNIKDLQEMKDYLISTNKETNDNLNCVSDKFQQLKKDFLKNQEENSKIKDKNQTIRIKLSKIKEKNNLLQSELLKTQENHDLLQNKYTSYKLKHKTFKENQNEFLGRFGLPPSFDFKSKNLKHAEITESPYDIVINIDSLKTQKYGWDIETTKFALSHATSKAIFSIIGLVGRENIGKTFILNKICGFDLPSGANVNTKGLSMKYSKNKGFICLDSAGMQTPVYYYEPKLLKRFLTEKENVEINEEIRRQMINDRTITDIFIQDFILEVCEVILIVVGQLSQNDQKFIERISSKYKAKKRIIILHNFSNLYSVKDVESKIQKDIIEAFDTIERYIPQTSLSEFIEKSSDNKKENISHLVIGVDWSESGQKYNEATFNYLRDILETRIDKKKFDLIKSLTSFFEENYRLYLQFQKRPTEKISLKYNEKGSLMIDSKENYEISNPIFNSLGSLITNPPYEVFEKKEKYIVLIELPNLDLKDIKIRLEKKKIEFCCLFVQGLKKNSEIGDENDNDKIISMRNSGEFSCLIPLGDNYNLFLKDSKDMYKRGILFVEVFKKEDIEETL